MDKAPDAFRTISEVADDLHVPQHVLRFWESRFTQIKPMKRAGGRRYYRPDDVDLLRGIHHLLYGEGYTIRGVQRILREHGPKFVQAVWQAGATQPLHDASDMDEPAGEEQGEEGRFGFVPSRSRDDDASADTDTARFPHAPMLPPSSIDRPQQHAGNSGRIDRENLRKLQTALHELSECRRLLDAAQGD
ncbi:MAG: MerR family transcriptional regulator [Rhizobiales bacterium]|nr:MerR family transcriptional regulator [Hyphomicrobiales bacterium]